MLDEGRNHDPHNRLLELNNLSHFVADDTKQEEGSLGVSRLAVANELWDRPHFESCILCFFEGVENELQEESRHFHKLIADILN